MNLFFSNGINPYLYYVILSLIIAILLTIIDRFLWGLIPNFLIGIAWLSVLITLILYLSRNFMVNLWSTLTGKTIIVVVILIISTLIFTTEFIKTRNRTIQVIKVITPSPTKIGEGVKVISKQFKRK